MTAPIEGQKFYQQGGEQLGHLLIGEPEAKVGMMLAIVSGENIVLVGDPGGAKTALGRHAHRIVEGIEDENVAVIPPDASLSGQQLVGGEQSATKVTKIDGTQQTEETTHHINPIIPTTTQLIFANEFNRANPYAINMVLEAFESGIIDSSAGTVELEDFEYGVITMNRSESREGTFRVLSAMGSRTAIGAILGRDEPNEEKIIANALTGWKPQPDKVEPITDLATIHALRNQAQEGVNIPGDLLRATTDHVKRLMDGLSSEAGIREAVGRISSQIGRLARAHAVLMGQETVTEHDTQLAMRYALTARLGMLSTSSSYDEMSGQIQRIIGK